MKSQIPNPKSQTNPKSQMLFAILISVFFHCLMLIAIFWINSLGSVKAEGEEYAVIALDVLSETSEATSEVPTKKEDPKRTKGKMSLKEKSTEKTLQKESKSSLADETSGSRGKIGTPGAAGTSNVLAKIRSKIERAKRYPRSAKRMGLEGRPTVLFQINSDGSVKFVKIAKSSGENVLDNAAMETVKNAAPLPYYADPIKLALKFELSQ